MNTGPVDGYSTDTETKIETKLWQHCCKLENWYTQRISQLYIAIAVIAALSAIIGYLMGRCT